MLPRTHVHCGGKSKVRYDNKMIFFKWILVRSHDQVDTDDRLQSHSAAYKFFENVDVPLDDVEMGPILGRGGFGKVYKGTYPKFVSMLVKCSCSFHALLVQWYHKHTYTDPCTSHTFGGVCSICFH